MHINDIYEGGRPYDRELNRFIVGREESLMYKPPIIDQFGEPVSALSRHKRIGSRMTSDIKFGIAIHTKELDIEAIKGRHNV